MKRKYSIAAAIVIVIVAYVLMRIPGVRNLSILDLKTKAVEAALAPTVVETPAPQRVPTEEQKGRIYKFAASKDNYLKKIKNYNLLIIRTDAKGDCVWSTTCPSKDYTWGEFVMQDKDGNFTALAKRYNEDEGLNFEMINISRDGSTSEAIGFDESEYKVGTPFVKLDDGGEVNLNMTYSETGSGRLSMTRKDKWKNSKWRRSYGMDFYDWGETEIYSPDGTSAVIGYTDNYTPYDGKVLLIKKNKRGSTQWVKTFGGEQYDWAYSLMSSGDGGYVIGGLTYSYGIGKDSAYIIKTDSKGDCVWAKTYGGRGYNEAYCAIPVRNGFVFAGTTADSPGSYNAWLVKLDKHGRPFWEKKYGSEGDQIIYYVSQISDGGYIMVGASSTPIHDTKATPEPTKGKHKKKKIGTSYNVG